MGNILAVLFVALFVLIGGLGDAQAQTTYNSRCGWSGGVYSCNSRTETPRSVTTTLCASGGLGSACTSKSVQKELPPPPPPSYAARTDVRVSGPRTKADNSEAAAVIYLNPGAVSLCPPPRKMTRDGCQ